MVERMGLPEGTVTFLFTDIEASTRLLDRLGRDAYGELLQTHRRLLRQAITGAAGFEVDEQGDALLAVFTSAGNAVTAAVSGQRALVAQEWPAGVELRVRMGLHTGEATLAGEGYVGIAVHRGRRVCEAAHGAQVVLSSATRTILGSELPSGVELRDLGEVGLAGFDEPERLFQVLAAGLVDAFPAPRAQRPRRDEPSALLERADELAAVDRAIADAQSGAGRLLVADGPAGIGKTALLAEARTRAAESGLRVLQARGSELEAAFSFGVVRQLFEATVDQASAEDRARLLAGAASPAARLFGGENPVDEDAYALLHGLYWLTVNLADGRSPSRSTICSGSIHLRCDGWRTWRDASTASPSRCSARFGPSPSTSRCSTSC
jgi:class 3 adenylate cyclase